MKRKLSPWCKEVKKTLIDRDMLLRLEQLLAIRLQHGRTMLIRSGRMEVMN